MQEAPIPKLKSTEVLVKVHAVSLQFRDLIVAKGQYPLGQKDNVVPGSDMAGEIIAVGEEVKGWNVGERVCANFNVDHIYGDVTLENKNSALGAPIDGVLTEYKVLPAHVSISTLRLLGRARIRVAHHTLMPRSRSSASPSTSAMRRHPRSPVQHLPRTMHSWARSL